MINNRVESPVSIDSKNIKPIHINGLKGRIGYFPATDKKNRGKTQVIISGHHTSHERMLSFADFLIDFGDVYMIDLPGFGGMDSFKKINKKINIDNYATYLYTLLNTQKLNKNITIFAVSIANVFLIRMFQMYPKSEEWVDKVVGFVGFGSKKDFIIKPPIKITYWTIAIFGSTRIGAGIIRILFFNRLVLLGGMNLFSKFKGKMSTSDKQLQKKFIQMEAFLWQNNDMQTQAITTKMMFTADTRKLSNRTINVPYHNILTKKDQYIDYKEVNKTMRDLYNNYTPHYILLDTHMPSMISDKSEVAKLFDDELINEIISTN